MHGKGIINMVYSLTLLGISCRTIIERPITVTVLQIAAALTLAFIQHTLRIAMGARAGLGWHWSQLQSNSQWLTHSFRTRCFLGSAIAAEWEMATCSSGAYKLFYNQNILSLFLGWDSFKVVHDREWHHHWILTNDMQTLVNTWVNGKTSPSFLKICLTWQIFGFSKLFPSECSLLFKSPCWCIRESDEVQSEESFQRGGASGSWRCHQRELRALFPLAVSFCRWTV